MSNPKQVTNNEDTNEPMGTDGVDTWPMTNAEAQAVLADGNGEWVDGRYVYDDGE